MLNYSIMKPEGILLLRPSAPLSKEDFGGLSVVVDAYLSEHPTPTSVSLQPRERHCVVVKRKMPDFGRREVLAQQLGHTGQGAVCHHGEAFD